MEVIGYLASIIMGIVLGLVGGGGSILTVPILVYLLSVSALEATAYSLFVVGAASLIASIDYFKRGLVDVKIGLIFATPAFASVYAVRRYGMPRIPDTISFFNMSITKDGLILGVFAVVMLVASISMIRGRKDNSNTTDEQTKINYWLVLAEGVGVGALTGFVGAGGGFIIIPALVLLAGLEMKVAVGTSLFIIAIKSLLGFTGDLANLKNIDWNLLLTFTAFAIVGIMMGIYFSRKVPGEKLKPAFGWFVLVMGGAILIQQILS